VGIGPRGGWLVESGTEEAPAGQAGLEGRTGRDWIHEGLGTGGSQRRTQHLWSRCCCCREPRKILVGCVAVGGEVWPRNRAGKDLWTRDGGVLG